MSEINISSSAALLNQRQLPAFFGHASVWAGWDRTQAWFKHPLSGAEMRQVLDAGAPQIFSHYGAAIFDIRYTQRLTFMVPTKEAHTLLRDMRDPDDVLVNLGEPGLSINVPDDALKAHVEAYIDRTWVTRHHAQHRVAHKRGEDGTVTRYSGPAYAPNVNALYSYKPCRFTGEVDCVHPDRRIKGAAACRAAGITGFASILAFDHQAFWRKHLQLYEMDWSKFGRMFSNQGLSRKRRGPLTYRSGRFTYDCDARLGGTLAQRAWQDGSGKTIQQIVDRYHGVLPIKRCLVRVDTEPLLTGMALY